MNPERIKAIIWDLDGTLYRFNAAFIGSCNVSAARVAAALCPDMTYEAALEIARKSEEATGFSLYSFLFEHGMAFGDVHAPFHNGIDEYTIEKCLDTAAALRMLGRPHAIVTHGTRIWARRVLTHLSIGDLFDETHVFPLEDFAYVTKSKSPVAFEAALSLLGSAPHETLVVEDTDHNLITAKALGCHTVLVHNDGKHHEKPAYVDYMFSTTLDLVTALRTRTAA